DLRMVLQVPAETTCSLKETENDAVVFRRRRKSQMRQRFPSLDGQRPLRMVQLLNGWMVTIWIDNYGHISKILRRRSNHRRSSDVDLFDRFCERDVFVRNRL